MSCLVVQQAISIKLCMFGSCAQDYCHDVWLHPQLCSVRQRQVGLFSPLGLGRTHKHSFPNTRGLYCSLSGWPYAAQVRCACTKPKAEAKVCLLDGDPPNEITPNCAYQTNAPGNIFASAAGVPQIPHSVPRCSLSKSVFTCRRRTATPTSHSSSVRNAVPCLLLTPT